MNTLNNTIPSSERIEHILNDSSVFQRLRQEFALYCAESVKHLMTDDRSLNALAITRRYLVGNASLDELKQAQDAAYNAAYAATSAAYNAAATSAAYNAAYAAAYNAATSAAYNATSAAYWATEALCEGRKSEERVLKEKCVSDGQLEWLVINKEVFSEK